MSRFLTASQTVSFTGGAGGARIVMQLEPGVFRRDYAVRIFPFDVDRVVASVGSVTLESVRPLQIQQEPVSFQGADEATPRFPIHDGFRFYRIGQAFTPEGGDVSPTLYHDPASGRIRSSVPVVGAFTVDYQARYQRVLYRPTILARNSYELGTVFAFKAGVVASLAIDLQQDEADDYNELYSVISYAVVQGDSPGRISDVWELPPGWPEDATYPGIPVDGGPDPEASVTVQRVHERAFINLRGAIFRRPIQVAREQPYAGVLGYHPVYELSRASAGGEYTQVIQDAPWDEIIEALRSRYPGITTGSGD